MHATNCNDLARTQANIAHVRTYRTWMALGKLVSDEYWLVNDIEAPACVTEEI